MQSREKTAIFLTSQERNDAQEFLKGGVRSVEETQIRLGSLVSENNLKWSESSIDRLNLKTDGLSRSEALDRRIADYLSWWVRGEPSSSSLLKLDERRIRTVAEMIEGEHIYSGMKKMMYDLGLLGGLNNIQMFLLNRGEMVSKFCTRNENNNKRTFVVAADYISSFKKYPVYTVFGINSLGIEKTQHIEIGEQLKKQLADKCWREWRKNRKLFYGE